MALDVRVWPLHPYAFLLVGDSEHQGDEDDQGAITFTDVDYVSLVNAETYGKPPLVTSDRDGTPAKAKDNDVVLYINPTNVTAFEITKLPR